MNSARYPTNRVLFALMLAIALVHPVALTAQMSISMNADDVELQIGTAAGDQAYEFENIQSLIQLADGKILVADRGSNQIRIFDPDGTHLATAGREGGGPGEFGSLSRLTTYRGDSLAAFDFRGSRVSVFDGSGVFGRSFVLYPPSQREGRTSLLGPAGDGGFIVLVNNAQRAVGTSRSTLSIHHYSAEGRHEHELGVYPGRESFARVDGNRRMDMISPFGLSTATTTGNGWIAVGDNGSYSIEVTRGDQSHTVGQEYSRLSITQEHIDAMIDERSASLGGDIRDEVVSILRELPVPEELPVFDRLLFDSDGNLWVRHFRVARQVPATWDVFNPQAGSEATLHTPPNFEISQIGADFILGVWRDDVGVEHVRRYPLTHG